MTNIRPLFSVIIPTYNRAKLLDRCLMSLYEQTYKNFEVLVCDDGSTDNSKDIAEKYADKLNIQYFWEPNWGGPARPRNRGIMESQGEWICLLDSDDWWRPNKLECCLPYLDEYDLIYHDLKVERKKDNCNRVRLMKGRVLKNNFVKDLLVNGNAICNSSVILRKKIICTVGLLSEDPQLIAVEDIDYWLRVVKYTNKLLYIPEVLGYYWIEENISRGIEHIDREVALFEKHKSELSSKDIKTAKKILHYKLARLYHRNGSFALAIKNYRKGITFKSNTKYATNSLIGYALALFQIRK